MLLWALWVVMVIAVLALKAYSAQTILRMNAEISELSQQLGRMIGEEKSVRANVEVLTRNLSHTQRATSVCQQELEKLNAELLQLVQEEKKEMMESKRKLGGLGDPEEG